MVYMAAVMVASPGGGHGGAGLPLVTGVLLVCFAGYALWAGVRLMPVPAAVGTRVPAVRATGRDDRPELARACRLSMGIGMFAMLPTV